MITRHTYKCKTCTEKTHRQKKKNTSRSKEKIKDVQTSLNQNQEQGTTSTPHAKIIFKGKSTLFQCKICNGILTDGAEREKHLSECHQNILNKLKIPPTLAIQHLFEIIPLNEFGEIIPPNHYRCKLCKEILTMPEDKQYTHYDSKHALILERCHMSADLAAKIYREPIFVAKKEPPSPQNVLPQFHSTQKELKKIHSSKISFISNLIEGLRGRRTADEHHCQRCGFNCSDPWEYHIEGYEPIYLCEKCHRQIKCGNFVPSRIIYSGFETGRKKH